MELANLKGITGYCSSCEREYSLKKLQECKRCGKDLRESAYVKRENAEKLFLIVASFGLVLLLDFLVYVFFGYEMKIFHKNYKVEDVIENPELQKVFSWKVLVDESLGYLIMTALVIGGFLVMGAISFVSNLVK